MFTEKDTELYHQTKDVKHNTALCVTCRRTIPMTIDRSIGFGIYQCSECGEKETLVLAKIKGR